jgi:hypothetical protein
MFKDLSLGLIEHFWNSGSYTIKDMINLVLEGTITEEEFHDITRYSFKGIIENSGKN